MCLATVGGRVGAARVLFEVIDQIKSIRTSGTLSEFNCLLAGDPGFPGVAREPWALAVKLLRSILNASSPARHRAGRGARGPRHGRSRPFGGALRISPACAPLLRCR